MMMGRRERHEAATVRSSSIALLQERFRELQRVKEMREERQLLKILTQHNNHQYLYSNHLNMMTQSNELTTSSSLPQLINPSSSTSNPPQVSLTLWPTSQEKQQYGHTRGHDTQPPQSSSWKNVSDCDSHSDSGVDTSLRL